MAHAKALGYEIILVFIHLSNDALNLARVAQRTREGGHSVPAEKVISRIPRVLKLIKQTLPLCNQVYLLDNSRLDNPLQQVAVIRAGQIHFLREAIPVWAGELLADYLAEPSDSDQ